MDEQKANTQQEEVTYSQDSQESTNLLLSEPADMPDEIPMLTNKRTRDDDVDSLQRKRSKNSFGYHAICDVPDDFISTTDPDVHIFILIQDGNLEKISNLPLTNDRYIIIKSQNPATGNVAKVKIAYLILDEFTPSNDFKISQLFDVQSVELGKNFHLTTSFVDDLIGNQGITTIMVSTTEQLRIITNHRITGTSPNKRTLAIHIPLKEIPSDIKNKIPNFFDKLFLNCHLYQATDLWNPLSDIRFPKVLIRYLAHENGDFSVINTIVPSTDKLGINVFQRDSELRNYCNNLIANGESKILIIEEPYEDYTTEVLIPVITPRLSARLPTTTTSTTTPR